MRTTTGRLVLLRHGESLANADGCFGGWWDAPLTQRGMDEARAAGEALRNMGLRFDLAHASLLQRAQVTRSLVLDTLSPTGFVALRDNWRLNERHYGALQGMSRADAVARYGEAQVQAWRRDYDACPPRGDDAAPPADAPLPPPGWPRTPPRAESLRELERRVAPLWQQELLPALRAGADQLIVSHGNTLRALLRLAGQRGFDPDAEQEIPTGRPVICEPVSSRS